MKKVTVLNIFDIYSFISVIFLIILKMYVACTVLIKQFYSHKSILFFYLEKYIEALKGKVYRTVTNVKQSIMRTFRLYCYSDNIKLPVICAFKREKYRWFYLWVEQILTPFKAIDRTISFKWYKEVVGYKKITLSIIQNTQLQHCVSDCTKVPIKYHKVTSFSTNKTFYYKMLFYFLQSISLWCVQLKHHNYFKNQNLNQIFFFSFCNTYFHIFSTFYPCFLGYNGK